VTSNLATTPLITIPTYEQFQPQHATTDQSSNQTRPTTKHRTAHLGITIRWVKNQNKAGTRRDVVWWLVVDLEGRV